LLCDCDGRPLVWHYSRAAGEVGSMRVKAFCSERLRYITSCDSPIQFFRGSTFLLRRLHGGAHLVGATSANINVALAMAVLVGLERVLLDFGVISASEALRSWDLLPRVHLFYAIMEEALDNGVPQTLDLSLLRKQLLLDTSGGGPLMEGNSTEVMPKLHATDSQVLIDMVERVSVQLDSTGSTISAEVHGAAQLRCHLGGQPTCVMVLSDAAKGQAMQFHESVRLGVAGPGEAVFTPPGGGQSFTLMSWHRVGHVTPPLKVSCSRIDHGRTRMELVIRLHAQLPSSDLTVFDLRASVPLPALTSSIKTLTGGAPSSAKWVRGENSVRWKVKALPAEGEASLAIEVSMAPRTHDASPGETHHLAPIVLTAFSVPGHTATGLRVRALRVLDYPLNSVAKLVRYTVCAGDYEIRMPTWHL
jgi:hypothetical protein